MREAVAWTVLWVALGLSFSGLIYAIYEYRWFGACGSDASLRVGGGLAVTRYLTAYVIEKALSVDNIFVMSLLFRSFGVPEMHQHRVLFWGIAGALVFRGLMIAGGVWFVTRFLTGNFLAVFGRGFEPVSGKARASSPRSVH